MYEKTPNSGTLLVVNQQTTKEELKAWKELAGFIFGDENPAGVVDVWDISQEGDLDLNSVLKSGSTLIEDWRDSTIVVLDNLFENFRTLSANEGQDNALQYVNPDQLVEAAVSNGTHFCVVSPLLEQSAAQRQHLAAPQRGIDFTSLMAFETVRHLLDPFAIEPTSFVVYGHSMDFVAAEVNVLVDNTTIQAEGFWPWSAKPQEPIHKSDPNPPPAYTRVEHIILVQSSTSLEKVAELAEKLKKELLRKHPERRYTLSVCHAQEIGDILQQIGCQIPPKTQAGIRVRRLLDVVSLSSRITLTAAPASPVEKTALSPNAATIHTPEFIKSPQVTSAFVQSIPYARRIALYVEALGSSPSMNEEQRERAGVLRASLLADLACEQEALRLRKRNHGLTEGCFKLLLPRLSAFCQIDLPAGMPPESAGRLHFLALLGDLKAYMKCKSSWYQPTFLGYRSSQVTKVSKDLIDGLMSRISLPESSATKRVATASSKTLKGWKKDLKSTKKSLSRRGTPDYPVTLKGRAFAALLGSVACGENKWFNDPNNHASIAGSVCTEFGILSTPESFAACRNPAFLGHPTRAEAASDGSGLGSITRNRDSMMVTNSSITRKATIQSRSTLNKRLASDLTSNGDAWDLPPPAETEDGTSW
jgi:hypothetical protein